MTMIILCLCACSKSAPEEQGSGNSFGAGSVVSRIQLASSEFRELANRWQLIHNGSADLRSSDQLFSLIPLIRISSPNVRIGESGIPDPPVFIDYGEWRILAIRGGSHESSLLTGDAAKTVVDSEFVERCISDHFAPPVIHQWIAANERSLNDISALASTSPLFVDFVSNKDAVKLGIEPRLLAVVNALICRASISMELKRLDLAVHDLVVALSFERRIPVLPRRVDLEVTASISSGVIKSMIAAAEDPVVRTVSLHSRAEILTACAFDNTANQVLASFRWAWISSLAEHIRLAQDVGNHVRAWPKRLIHDLATNGVEPSSIDTDSVISSEDDLWLEMAKSVQPTSDWNTSLKQAMDTIDGLHRYVQEATSNRTVDKSSRDHFVAVELSLFNLQSALEQISFILSTTTNTNELRARLAAIILAEEGAYAKNGEVDLPEGLDRDFVFRMPIHASGTPNGLKITLDAATQIDRLTQLSARAKSGIKQLTDWMTTAADLKGK